MRKQSTNNPSEQINVEQRLKSLASAMYYSASWPEREFYRHKLSIIVNDLLKEDVTAPLVSAIDALANEFEEGVSLGLTEVVETASQSRCIEIDGQKYVTILTVIPIIAWTHFTVPTGSMDERIFKRISNCFEKYIVHKGNRFALIPQIYTQDQLTLEYSQMYALNEGMINLLNGKPFEPTLNKDDSRYFADPRFILGIIAAPQDKPIYAWHEFDDKVLAMDKRQQGWNQWQKYMSVIVKELLPGCDFELPLPRAYCHVFHDVDRMIRVPELITSVNYLTQVLKVSPDQLGVVIAACGEPNQPLIEEYRISFYKLGEDKIVCGVLWPTFHEEKFEESIAPEIFERYPQNAENHDLSNLASIFKTLNELGVAYEKNIVKWYELEYCEECGGALYIDLHGEFIHPEMPEIVKEPDFLH